MIPAEKSVGRGRTGHDAKHRRVPFLQWRTPQERPRIPADNRQGACQWASSATWSSRTKGPAGAILAADNLWETYPTYQTKLLDPVTLDGLFALLDPESPEIETWWDTPLAEEEEQAVYQLPPALVARLAGLSEAERHDLAWRWWQQSEELALAYKFSGLKPEEIVADIRDLVDEVCAFLRQAVEAGQRVYLFMSA